MWQLIKPRTTLTPKTRLVTLLLNRNKSWTLSQGGQVTGEPAAVHTRLRVHTHCGTLKSTSHQTTHQAGQCSFPRGKISMFKMKVWSTLASRLLKRPWGSFKHTQLAICLSSITKVLKTKISWLCSRHLSLKRTKQASAIETPVFSLTFLSIQTEPSDARSGPAQPHCRWQSPQGPWPPQDLQRVFYFTSPQPLNIVAKQEAAVYQIHMTVKATTQEKDDLRQVWRGQGGWGG